MQQANGRQKQNAYRFKPRARDVPQGEESGGASGSRVEADAPVVIKSAKNKELKNVGDNTPVKANEKSNEGKSHGKLPVRRSDQEFSQSLVLPIGPCRIASGQYKSSISSTVTGPLKLKQMGGNNENTGCDSATARNGLSTCGIDSGDGGWQMQRQQRSRPTGNKTGGILVGNANCHLNPTTRQQAEVCTARMDTVSSNERKTSDSVNPPDQFLPCHDSTTKKKKKKLNKTERLKLREEAVFKELYKPKDSRVTLIDSDLFQKIKTGSSSSNTTLSSSVLSVGVFDFSSSPIPSPSSVCDFPTLNAHMQSPVTQFKTFAAALNSPSGHLRIDERKSTPGQTASLSGPQLSASATCASDTVKKPKLSKRLITFNISDMIQSQKTNNAVANKQIARKPKHDKLSAIRQNHKLTVGNLLDSSGPVIIHRGKIKEKKKKPSRLKRSILQSREIKKTLSKSFFSTIIVNESSSENCLDSTFKCDTSDCDTDVICPIEHQRDEGSVLNSISDLGLCLPEVTESKSNLSDESSNVFKVLLEDAEESSKTPTRTAIHLAKLQMHNRKFRDYCDMIVTKEFHGLVISIMQELHRLQDRVYKTDPMKLQTKRRYVNGIKEVLSALRFRKVQLVILAPDIEPHSGEGGLDNKTSEILSLAVEKKIPYVFSGNRFILGRCIKQTKSPVSAIAILDKQSVEDQFNILLQSADALREQYKTEFNTRVQAVMANGG